MTSPVNVVPSGRMTWWSAEKTVSVIFASNGVPRGVFAESSVVAQPRRQDAVGRRRGAGGCGRGRDHLAERNRR